MLSATPVNNKFTDLKNQIALAYEGQTDVVDKKMDISKSINSILNNAQRTFNDWLRLPIKERTGAVLLSELNKNFDFFKLLDNITISRSRKHITKYYNTDTIGGFPNRLKPITYRSKITEIENFMNIEELYKKLTQLNMSFYSPFDYILSNKIQFYNETYDTQINENSSLKQSTREKSLQTLMRINLLKRLESSVDSFRITLGKFTTNIDTTIKSIDAFEKSGISTQTETTHIADIDLDSESDDWLDEEFSIGEKSKSI